MKNIIIAVALISAAVIGIVLILQGSQDIAQGLAVPPGPTATLGINAAAAATLRPEAVQHSVESTRESWQPTPTPCGWGGPCGRPTAASTQAPTQVPTGTPQAPIILVPQFKLPYGGMIVTAVPTVTPTPTSTPTSVAPQIPMCPSTWNGFCWDCTTGVCVLDPVTPAP